MDNLWLVDLHHQNGDPRTTKFGSLVWAPEIFKSPQAIFRQSKVHFVSLTPTRNIY